MSDKNEKNKRGKGSENYKNKSEGTGKETVANDSAATTENTGTNTTEQPSNTTENTTTQESVNTADNQAEDATTSDMGDDGGAGEETATTTTTQGENEPITEIAANADLPSGDELKKLPTQQFNPYADEAIVRDYAVSHGPQVESIPEPQFANPPGFGGATSKKPDGPIMSDIPTKGPVKPGATGTGGAGGAQGTGAQPLNQNPLVNEMSPKEKKIAAENSVEAFFSLYGMLNDLGYHIAHVSDERLLKMEMKDEIDLAKEIAVAGGSKNKVTVRGFIESFNLTARKAFTVDEDLKARVREPMIREAMRLGLVMTDGQFIAKEIGQDILTKTVTLIGLKTQINNTITLLVEDHKARRQQEVDNVERLKKENESLKAAAKAVAEKRRQQEDEDFDEEEDEEDDDSQQPDLNLNSELSEDHPDRAWEKHMQGVIKLKAGSNQTNSPVKTDDVPVDQQ